MTSIDVNSQDLRDQATAVSGGALQVHDVLTTLTGQIQDLAGRWRSSASDAFQSRWHEWQQSATQIQQAMDDMGTFLQQAAEQYEETERVLGGSGG